MFVCSKKHYSIHIKCRSRIRHFILYNSSSNYIRIVFSFPSSSQTYFSFEKTSRKLLSVCLFRTKVEGRLAKLQEEHIKITGKEPSGVSKPKLLPCQAWASRLAQFLSIQFVFQCSRFTKRSAQVTFLVLVSLEENLCMKWLKN